MSDAPEVLMKAEGGTLDERVILILNGSRYAMTASEADEIGGWLTNHAHEGRADD